MSSARTSDVSEDSCPPPRTIVLCFDGTNQQYGSTNTNVVKFFGLLSKDRPDEQVAYYQAGIGTYFAPGVVSPIWVWLASLLDEASAWYLNAHVMGGYMYLMENYRSGDKICLFGFSRGAYTARALAGMLQKVGLLPRDNLQQIGFAYKAYKRTDKEGIKLAAGFKRTFSRNVKVEFVGVWDTVQSTGVLINRVLPFTESNNAIKVFRHALSLDEHRARFRPNLYHWSSQDDVSDEETEPKNATTRGFHAVKSKFMQILKRKNQGIQQHEVGYKPLADGARRSEGGYDVPPDSTEHATFVAEEESPCTDVLEVWFSGCHSDIGGGNVRDGVKVSLAQITLRWMIEQVIHSQCGILFDNDELAHIGITASSSCPGSLTTRGPQDSDINARFEQEPPTQPKQPTPNPETHPQHSDAIAPLFDELRINKLWWLLEFMPCGNAWQNADGEWHNKWSVNLGKGRFIPFREPKFHHTVKERMDCKSLEYKPRAIYDHHEVYV